MVGAACGPLGAACGPSDRVHKTPPSAVAHIGPKRAPATEWQCWIEPSSTPEGYEIIASPVGVGRANETGFEVPCPIGPKRAPAIEEDEPGWDCATMGNGHCEDWHCWVEPSDAAEGYEWIAYPARLLPVDELGFEVPCSS